MAPATDVPSREKKGRNKIPREFCVPSDSSAPGTSTLHGGRARAAGACGAGARARRSAASWQPPVHGDDSTGAAPASASTAADPEERSADDAATSWAPQASLATTKRPLVLVLGLPKCGTTSLHEAFRSVGYESVHWALNAGKDVSADKQLRLWGVDADRRLIARLMHRAASQGLPPLALLPPGVDAVAEMNGLFWADKHAWVAEGHFPQMSLLEQLVLHYPDARFILNIREHRRWVKSVDQHNDLRRRLVCADLPGLPRGVGKLDDELIAWVDAHHRRVQALLSHHGARLLVFDIERHGEPELSAFLGAAVTWACHNAT